MTFVPIHVHSDFSFLTSTLDCEKIAKTCKKLGYKACAVTDYGSASSFVEFSEACKAQKIKPILGVDAYVCALESDLKTDQNRKLTHLPILCKNLEGVKAMFKAVSQSNRQLHHKPRLALNEWARYSKGNWIAFSGHPGSDLFNAVCKNGKIVENALQNAKECIDDHQFFFGKENFFVNIQLIDKENQEFMEEVAAILREAAKFMGADCVATGNSHYSTRDDAADQRVLLCALLKTTLPKVFANLDTDDAKDVDVASFFKSENYHIPEIDEMLELHKGYEHEVSNSVKIADMCEEYSLKRDPQQPIFDKDIDAYEEMAERAREGWRNLLNWPKESPQFKEYGDRIRMELDVLKNNNLSNYFLIVTDICDYAVKNGILMGPGRGSGAGCLISYLVGITQVDPIKHGLLFERFFNAARKNSLPDIDLDFPPAKREQILEYIETRYNKASVAKIATFTRLQGKAILKQVLKVHEACDFATENQMTEFIPDESTISDDLQEMYEEDDESAKILQWAVINHAKELAPWVKLEKDGTYSGEFGKYFAQAIRLEGLYKNVSEHPSGVIIAPGEIDDFCPLINSKGKLLAAMPYPLLELMGLCKFDILGVSAYGKLMMIINAMEYGDIYGNGNSDEDDESDSEEETDGDN
jgi:DNA polymerase-3 subunit alpha